MKRPTKMTRRKYAIIMAAGSGTRMGAEVPKQFIELEGKAILQRTIELFLTASPGVSIVLTEISSVLRSWSKAASPAFIL